VRISFAETQGPHQFKERYEVMYGSGPKPTVKRNKNTGVMSLLRELSDDEDEDSTMTPSSSGDSDKPWWREFRGYLDTIHEVPEGMTSVKWWGVSPLHLLQ